ncbi:MAG: hypothetical protein KDK70_11055, partial [Myxococcales bacterium]|nr:hypothetical protein [Myxococcales bacterium]
MASWTQVEIREGVGWLDGVKARAWMERNHPEVMPSRKQTGKFIVVLELEAGFIFGEAALVYLEDLLGAAFRRKPRGRAYVKQSKLVRRRLENAVRAPAPKYVLQLQLLNCNRAFTAIEPRNALTPWRDRGVQERLQALGYLYTPLTHPSIVRDAEACFGYYKAIRQKAAGADDVVDDARAVRELVQEIRCNLVTAELPRSGQIFEPSTLPARNRLAALRFPGGFCTTKSAGPNNPRSGDYVHNQGRASNPGAQYDFSIGD